MASSLRKFVVADLADYKSFTTKPVDHSADRREKFAASIKSNLDAIAADKQPVRGFMKPEKKNADLVWITPKIGRTVIKLGDDLYLKGDRRAEAGSIAIPRDQVTGFLTALHAGIEAGDFDQDIARAFGDGAPTQRRTRQRRVSKV